MIERNDDLDRRLRAYGAELDSEIARSGAPDRVRRNVLRRGSADLFADLSWRRVAAAILVAGMLGAAVDLMFLDRTADQVDVASVDPLYAFDEAGSQ